MSQIIVALYVITTSLGLIVLKLSSSSSAVISYVNNKISLNLNFWTIFGIMLYGTSFLIYMYLISKYDLGYIIPITTALVYVLIFVASFIIFKESFTFAKIVGIVLILIGIAFINLSKSTT